MFRSFLHYSEVIKAYVLPFLGSDRSVVMRSQRHFYEHEKQRPVQMYEYFKAKSYIMAILTLLGGMIFGVMAQFKITRYFLETVRAENTEKLYLKNSIINIASKEIKTLIKALNIQFSSLEFVPLDLFRMKDPNEKI